MCRSECGQTSDWWSEIERQLRVKKTLLIELGGNNKKANCKRVERDAKGTEIGGKVAECDWERARQQTRVAGVVDGDWQDSPT